MQLPIEEHIEVRLWLRYRNWTMANTLSLRERATQLQNWLVENRYHAEVAELMNDNIALRLYATPGELNQIGEIITKLYGFDIVFDNSNIIGVRNAPEPAFIREKNWAEKAPEFDTWDC